jgi:hypothetical protein
MAQPIGDVVPSLAFATLSRQMTLDQLAHVSERAQCHNSGNFQRPQQQLPRPIRAGQNNASYATQCAEN